MPDRSQDANPVEKLPLLRAFQFWVNLTWSGSPDDGVAGTSFGNGGFQECSGLELELDIQEYNEGGRNHGPRRLVGRMKTTNLVLKRGMLMTAKGVVNSEIWGWLQGIADDERPVRRLDGSIEVMLVSDQVGATWEFSSGLPVKVVGPQLNAKTGEVAIEELHIAHENLRLVV